jgi:hypothetical protein
VGKSLRSSKTVKMRWTDLPNNGIETKGPRCLLACGMLHKTSLTDMIVDGSFGLVGLMGSQALLMAMNCARDGLAHISAIGCNPSAGNGCGCGSGCGCGL